MSEPTSVVLSVQDTPAELPGTHFTELVWEHRPLGPALATLMTGRDVFAHRCACDEDKLEARLPTLATLLESRGIEIGPADGQPTRPRFVADLTKEEGRAPSGREGPALASAAVRLVVAPNGLWLPGPTRTLRGVVRLIDVAATVLDLFGMIDLGWEHSFQGESVLDISDDSGTCRETYLTNCLRRGWRTREGEFWEPDLPQELAARVRGYVRRRVAETGLVDPLIRLGPEAPER